MYDLALGKYRIGGDVGWNSSLAVDNAETFVLWRRASPTGSAFVIALIVASIMGHFSRIRGVPPGRGDG